MYFFASLKHVTEWRLGQNVPSSGGGLNGTDFVIFSNLHDNVAHVSALFGDFDVSLLGPICTI